MGCLNFFCEGPIIFLMNRPQKNKKPICDYTEKLDSGAPTFEPFMLYRGPDVPVYAYSQREAHCLMNIRPIPKLAEKVRPSRKK